MLPTRTLFGAMHNHGNSTLLFSTCWFQHVQLHMFSSIWLEPTRWKQHVNTCTFGTSPCTYYRMLSHAFNMRTALCLYKRTTGTYQDHELNYLASGISHSSSIVTEPQSNYNIVEPHRYTIKSNRICIKA